MARGLFGEVQRRVRAQDVADVVRCVVGRQNEIRRQVPQRHVQDGVIGRPVKGCDVRGRGHGRE